MRICRTAGGCLLLTLLVAQMQPRRVTRDVIGTAADALPERGRVLLVVESAERMHPERGRVRDDPRVVEKQLAGKLARRLNDKRNRHKEIELVSWEGPPVEVAPSREEVMTSTRHREVTHVIFAGAAKHYRYDRTAGWIVARVDWSLELVNVAAGTAEMFEGAVEGWRFMGPEPLQSRADLGANP